MDGAAAIVLASLCALSLVASTPPLELNALPDPKALAQWLWEHAPEFQLARSRIAQAKADADRAHLLPNPQLDFSVNTLPVGQTNPAGLQNPYANVPNYNVGLSELIELGKRGPRQEAASQAARAVAYDALEQLRQRYHELQEHLGEIAAAEVRVDALRRLADDAARLTAIQRARLNTGDAAATDADRAQLEEDLFRANLGEAEESLMGELRACSQLVGGPCVAFKDPVKAQAWLSTPLAIENARADERPDVKSFEATAASARAAQTLAQRRAIPDPTLRLGYVRDQFVISGNQLNSFYVGLSIPLPVFDHGQADAKAAAATAQAADAARQQTESLRAVELSRIDEQTHSLKERQQLLNARALPLAKDVVERLDAAVKRGGAGFSELVLARRSLGELIINANQLDLASYRLQVARARATGGLPLPLEVTTP